MISWLSSIALFSSMPSGLVMVMVTVMVMVIVNCSLRRPFAVIEKGGPSRALNGLPGIWTLHIGGLHPSAPASADLNLIPSATTPASSKLMELSKSKSNLLSMAVSMGGGSPGGSGDGGGRLGELVGHAGKGPKLQKRQPSMPPALQPMPPNASSHGVKHSGS